MLKSIHKRIRSLRSSIKMSDEDETMTETPTTEQTVAIREKSEYNPSADLQLLRSFYSEFHLKCHLQECATLLRVEDANSHIETWLAETQCIPPLRQVSEITCWKCNAQTCIGCGSEPKLSGENIFTPVGVINHCCSQSRLFGMWLLLARFDEEDMRIKRAMMDANARRDKANKIAKKSGVGYAGGPHSFWPMGGIANRYKPFDESPRSELSGDVSDDLVTETLRLLNGFLSTPSADPGLSFSASSVELSLLRSSMLLDQVAVLLRNDSIEDWTERRSLYGALLGFVREILRHPDLTELTFERRPGKTDSPGLRALTESSRFRFIVDNETLSTSLFVCIENIYRQARVFLDLSKKTEKDTIGKESIRICQDVVSLYEVMHARMQLRPAVIEFKQPWVQYTAENRVMFTDDVLTPHRYHKAFSTVKKSNIGRLNTIGKEIANMTTSLPPGIFLKVAESRTDVMKVLIVGPEGGPYAGGLFIFDIFLDANYPTTPPQMHFVLPTADDDNSNFNPNLHVGGGVCLSLLNTWAGAPHEMWQPNKSTILTVLTSVQAMILGAPFPWANEPGRENSGDTDVSRSYNMSIQCKTIRGAMMFWLDEAGLQKSSAAIWKDISDMYWKYNGQDVLHGVMQWSKEGNQRLASYTPHAHLFPKRSKSKKSALKPESENLVQQLAELLGIPIKEEEYAYDASRKRKTLTGSEKSSKKTKSFSNMPLPGLPAAFPHDSQFFGGGTTLGEDFTFDELDSLEEEYMLQAYGFFPGEHIDLTDNDENKDPKWVYTGAKTRNETRAACKEFGIGAAQSIVDTISKLENYVNEKGTAGSDLFKKWGKMSGGSSSGLDSGGAS